MEVNTQVLFRPRANAPLELGTIVSIKGPRACLRDSAGRLRLVLLGTCHATA